MPIKAVIFDVFGTIAKVSEQRSPYLGLMRWMKTQGRRPQPDDALQLLTHPVGIAGAAQLFGMHPPTELLAEWEKVLWEELASVQLYPDTLPTMQYLKDMGLRVGLCSNLAAPYAVPIRAMLPAMDLYGWSFEIGAAKPDPKVYLWLLEQLQLSAPEVFFVGDTLEADVTGPSKAGLRAIQIVRTIEQRLSTPKIESLTALLPLLKSQ